MAEGKSVGVIMFCPGFSWFLGGEYLGMPTCRLPIRAEEVWPLSHYPSTKVLS